jgi:hypothetical protein
VTYAKQTSSKVDVKEQTADPCARRRFNNPVSRGLSSKEIDAAASEEAVAGIDPEYVLVCQATDELSKSGTLRDETLSMLLSKYGETVSRKLVLMIAWFNLLSRFLNGCRVPLETTDKIGTGTSPLG